MSSMNCPPHNSTTSSFFVCCTNHTPDFKKEGGKKLNKETGDYKLVTLHNADLTMLFR